MSAGIAHLGDLSRRYADDSQELSRLLDRFGLPLLEGEVSSPLPPARLVVVCHALELERLREFSVWLKRADSLSLILTYRDEAELWTDLDMRACIEEEVRALGLSWTHLWHLGEEDTEAIGEKVRELLQGCHPPPQPALFSRPTTGAGPWCEVPPHLYQAPELLWPRLICRKDDQPSLYLPEAGCFLSLRDGRRGETVPATRSAGTAIWLDGSRAVESSFRGNFTTTEMVSGASRNFSGPGGYPVGIWPCESVGWAGGRCTFDWLSIDSSGGCGRLSGCAHDWPCGHAKKQYGFLDNEPCWFQLSRGRDTYLSVYQKDAIVSNQVPVCWRRCAGGWSAQSPRSPQRALFFCHDPDNREGWPRESGGAEEAAEDSRDLRPAIALGPAGYVLDLGQSVFRLVDDECCLVHPPALSFGLYDGDHQPVSIEEGRLLGGWDESMVVLRGEQLWRLDLKTGAAQPIAREGSRIDWAFSVPATGNVVLVKQEEERTFLRLV